MKTHFVLPIIAILLSILVLTSCNKNKNIDIGCGCSTDSVSQYASYDNFGGFTNYEANLYFNHNFNKWFIGVNIPNTEYGALLEICNQELPMIRDLTDTSSRKSPISIKFSGKLTQLCPNQPPDFGYFFLYSTLCRNIIVDSLKKK